MNSTQQYQGYPGYPPPPRKTPVYKRVWFWLLVIVTLIVVFAIVGVSGSSSSSAPASGTASVPGASTPADDDPLSDGGWTLSDVQVDSVQYGYTNLSARVTNTEDSTRSGLFTLTIFNGDERVGQTSSSVADVEAGQAATVQFMVSEELPGDSTLWSYELQSDL